MFRIVLYEMRQSDVFIPVMLLMWVQALVFVHVLFYLKYLWLLRLYCIACTLYLCKSSCTSEYPLCGITLLFNIPKVVFLDYYSGAGCGKAVYAWYCI